MVPLVEIGEETKSINALVAGLVDLEGAELIQAAVERDSAEEIAVVSSFGAESVVLLHMVAEIDPTVPVLFLNTGKLFGETLRYRDRLQSRLGLTDIRSVGPHPVDLLGCDPDGSLWSTEADRCCDIRKVQPLAKALKPFRAQITGRKRFQTEARSNLPTVEVDPQRGQAFLKINPLVNWDLKRLNAYIEEHRLPKHPLVRDGYLSIGCMNCTDRVKPGGSYRDGRWAGSDKDECGIHLGENVGGDGI